jgi:hypothetical protein
MYSAELKSPVIPIRRNLKEYFPGYDTIHLSVYCNLHDDGHIDLPYGIALRLISHNGNGLRKTPCEIPYFEPCDTLEELVDKARELGNNKREINQILRDYARGKLCKDD